MSKLGDMFKPRMLTLAALDEIDKRVRPTICTTYCMPTAHPVAERAVAEPVPGDSQMTSRIEGRISEDDYDTLMAVARQFAKMP